MGNREPGCLTDSGFKEQNNFKSNDLKTKFLKINQNQKNLKTKPFFMRRLPDTIVGTLENPVYIQSDFA